MKLRIFACCLLACTVAGCSLFDPTWHSGQGRRIRHFPTQAVVYGNSLTISGEMSWLYAHTDYGVKVYKAVDDRGTPLQLRSFQIFWMKVPCFEIEFSPPHPEAANVEYDIAFTSRSGVQRLTGTLPIERNIHNYLMQLHRWTRNPAY
jgi:hypothetical protein